MSSDWPTGVPIVTPDWFWELSTNEPRRAQEDLRDGLTPLESEIQTAWARFVRGGQHAHDLPDRRVEEICRARDDLAKKQMEEERETRKREARTRAALRRAVLKKDTCTILAEHHADLEDDPDRLPTDFLRKLIGRDKPCPDE